MGVLFISHSRENDDDAAKIRDGLRGEGYSELFVETGTPDAPERWRRALRDAGSNCSAVIVLLSPAWVASPDRHHDLRLARDLGKRLIWASVAPLSEVPDHLGVPDTVVDVSKVGEGALENGGGGFAPLTAALHQAGLHPSDFDWPPRDDPDRSVYRGLATLQERDAAIFFGRDDEITAGLDAIRRIQDGSGDRVLAIVGRSGAGKSSFLRAGLLARLRRDSKQFRVLPVVRPGRDPLRGADGLWAALGLTSTPDDDDALRTRLQALRENGEGAANGDATLILAVDEAEELLSAENPTSAAGRALLQQCLAATDNLIVLVTIADGRMGLLDWFDLAPAVGVVTYRLPAPSRQAVMDMIQAPGQRRDPALAVSVEIDAAMAAELERPDALPLLALTLERLSESNPKKESASLTDYQRGLGGISGVVNAAVTAAYEVALRDPALPTNRTVLDELARSALIPWMVQIDEGDDPPKRKAALVENLPRPAIPLVEHLVAQRILTKATSDLGDTVEISHEAVLRNWWRLVDWIREERLSLERLQRVKRAAEAWDIDDRTRDQLVHRADTLTAAEALLKRPDLARELAGTPMQYLEACRILETQAQEDQIRGNQRRRWGRRLSTVLLLLVAGLTAWGLFAAYKGQRRVARTMSTVLTRESRVALASGHSARALRLSVLASRDSALSPAAVGAQFQLGRAALTARLASVLGGQADGLSTAVFSADRRYVLTASTDGSARVWQRDDDGQWRYATLDGHEGPVLAAAFAPDGERVVTGSADASARIWTRQGTGWTPQILQGHEHAVHAATFSADGARVLTASRLEAAPRIWQPSANGAWTSQALEVEGMSGGVEAVAFSGDGRRALVATTEGPVDLWTLGLDGAWTHTRLDGHRERVFAVAVSPDDTQFASASADQTVRVWRAQRSGRWTSDILNGHEAPVRAVAFSPDGARVVSGAADGEVRVWRALAGGSWRADRLDGHSRAVSSVHFSPDGLTVLSASLDATALLWRAPGGQGEWKPLRLGGHDAAVRNAEFSSDGATALTASDDGTARVWMLNPPVRATRLFGHQGWIDAVALSRDGQLAVTASRDGTARLWRPDGTFDVLKGHTAAVVAVAISPQGDRIVTASEDKTALVWGTNAEGQWVSEALTGHEAPMVAVAFSPDGGVVATASEDGAVQVWRRSVDRVWSPEALEGHTAQILSVAISAQDHVLTTSADATARLWSKRDGKWQATVLQDVRSAAFAAGVVTSGPNEDPRVITGGLDGGIRWQRGGAVDQVLTGHRGAVSSVTISSDGALIVSTSVDGEARVWRRGEEGWRPEALSGHSGPIDGASFFAEGQRVLTWAPSGDGTVRVWQRDEVGAWVDAALPEVDGAQAVAVDPAGVRVLTAAKATIGGRPVAHLWDIAWLKSELPTMAVMARDAPIASAVCETLMAQTIAAEPVRRPLAEVTQGDIHATGVLKVLGIDVGFNVCRPQADPVDSAVSRLLPRKWWSAFAQ